MEQEKNKVPSQENENPGLEKFQRAQELYERYFISNEEADFEEMITVLDSIYKNRVKSELREKGCCDKENYEDAMQDARQGIWTRIKKQRETGELHKEFSQYCGGIYTYKAEMLKTNQIAANSRNAFSMPNEENANPEAGRCGHPWHAGRRGCAADCQCIILKCAQ